MIFATNNANKVKEVKSLLNVTMPVISLQEAGIFIDIPEPHDTLEANAMEKSETIYRLTAQDCFSEDTGLEVEALDGEPGVRSARYAGEPSNPQKNMSLVLQKMEGATNRKARFRTVISLIKNGERHLFEGICEGQIAHSASGDQGFGYDPIFIPDGDNRSFAEMGLSEKNKFSHRKKAMQQLIDFLNHPHGKS